MAHRPARRLPKLRPPRPLDPSLFAVEEHTLRNGLQVRILREPSVPVASYHTFFKVGSRNERPGITGIAHLFEHLMFNGSKNFGPKEFDRLLESRGGTSNAYTSSDMTVYYEDFERSALETVIALESDRMGALALTEASLASEREVVKEERRMRVDNDTIGLLDEALHAILYKAHPYRWPVIGWMADIDAITRADCLDFFRTYYAPNNALVVLVGAVDPDEAFRAIERAYGEIQAGPAVPEVVESEPPPTGERRVEVRFPSQTPAWLLGFQVASARDPDTLVLDVIQTALGTGESSRLVQRLVYDEELATSIEVDFGWRIGPTPFTLLADLEPGGSPRKVEKAVLEELDAIAEKGLSATELQQAKNTLRAQSLHDVATCNGRAHTLGSHELLLGDWRTCLSTLETYANVTSADVRRVAQRFFGAERRAIAELVPEDPRRVRRGASRRA